MGDESTVFVFYTINPNTAKPTSWTYGKLPTGWWWVGAGSATCGYAQEEQFTGPPKSQAVLEKLLRTKFEKLKKDGILTKFKLYKKYPSCRTTRKVGRKSPADSATQFSEGTQKKGQDGKMWTVAITKAGVHRWVQ